MTAAFPPGKAFSTAPNVDWGPAENALPRAAADLLLEVVRVVGANVPRHFGSEVRTAATNLTGDNNLLDETSAADI